MSEKQYYDCHVFCCTNRRSEGHERGSCAAKGSEALRDYLKEKAKKIKNKTIRINTAGCLDRCELGPILVIYPDGIWYHYQNKEDLDEIFTKHLERGEIVERLKR